MRSSALVSLVLLAAAPAHAEPWLLVSAATLDLFGPHHVFYTGPSGAECGFTSCVAEPVDLGVFVPSEAALEVAFSVEGFACDPEDEGCAACATVLSSLAFAPGEDGAGAFSLTLEDTIPTTLHTTLGCGDNAVRGSVFFTAPAAEGIRTARLVVSTDSPYQQTIEIPLMAEVTTQPVARPGFVPESMSEPVPFTERHDITPGDRVYLSGAWSFDPTDRDAALTYAWEVTLMPPGTDPAALAVEQLEAEYSLLVANRGRYEVCLTVTRDERVSAPECLLFQAIDRDQLELKLTWANALAGPTWEADLDLHLTRSMTDVLCDEQDDCNWASRSPEWSSGDLLEEGVNPWLELEGNAPPGPEILSVDTPAIGTYRLYVHNRSDSAGTGTVATVGVFVGGVLQETYSRPVALRNLWGAVQVHLCADGQVDIASPSGADVLLVSDFLCVTPPALELDWPTPVCPGPGTAPEPGASKSEPGDEDGAPQTSGCAAAPAQLAGVWWLLMALRLAVRARSGADGARR
jgi:hypothetical protein